MEIYRSWCNTKKERNKQDGNFHIIGLLLYFAVYMGGFAYLENRDTEVHIIHTVFDDYIPFCEYFIIPYILWFVFVAVTVIYFAVSIERRNEYFQLVISLCMGMTIFLFISFVYPNGQDLRPELAGDGICIQLVRLLYKIDTPTNILPSLHVFNAAVCCSAILKNQRLKEKRGVAITTIILTVLIILSTVFLKQHSIVDVVLALLMHGMCCRLVYVVPERNLKKKGCVRYEIIETDSTRV